MSITLTVKLQIVWSSKNVVRGKQREMLLRHIAGSQEKGAPCVGLLYQNTAVHLGCGTLHVHVLLNILFSHE